MRYAEIRRPRGMEGLWLRLKLWLSRPAKPCAHVVRDLSDLPDHVRRDIGLPDPVRYVDWRALRDGGWR